MPPQSPRKLLQAVAVNAPTTSVRTAGGVTAVSAPFVRVGNVAGGPTAVQVCAESKARHA